MTMFPAPKDAPLAHQKGRRHRSYSWAELGSQFRAARMAGNEALAAQLKQAIEMKKEIRKARKKGIDISTPSKEEGNS